MTMTAFERQILAELRAETGNRKLKEKDMLEWRLGFIPPREGETVIKLPLTGASVAYPTPVPKVSKKAASTPAAK